jgi:signal transduction histidine kinase
MSRKRTKAVVAASPGFDDGLLLPRPPGALRRFWARHPLTTDIVIALTALLVSLPQTAIRADVPEPTALEMWFAIALVLLGCGALVWRRRRPLTVFFIAAAPSLLLSPSLATTGHVLLAYALYAVAVYGSARACWIAFGGAATAILVLGAITYVFEAIPEIYAVTGTVTGIITLLIGALIGVNVGNRRRYLAALIDRSRQLLVERDQQAQLAAAAERTRIAREMHDIVSHSLTVIVALAEGAAAASDPERARVASRGAADTARAAMTEMRAMLGVLRDDPAAPMPLVPLEPSDPAEVIDAAQRAGFPVTASFTGSSADAPVAVRFALGRVVQEAVTNAMRHAPRATGVHVVVAVDTERVVVTVDNDGVGPRRPDAPSGFGLRGLEERIEHVGGALTAGPVDANTWRLSATLPLQPPTVEEPS